MPSNSSAKIYGLLSGINRLTIYERIIGYIERFSWNRHRTLLTTVFGQGVYVLQDNAFKPISRISSWEGRAEAVRRARLVRNNFFIYVEATLTSHPVRDDARRYHSRRTFKTRLSEYSCSRGYFIATMHAFF